MRKQPNVLSSKPPTVPSSNTNWELERIKLLFDYTKFHIGLYVTLASVLVAALGSKFAEPLRINRWAIGMGVILIAVAGWAGGIVAATLPEVAGRHKEEDIWDVPTGPGKKKWTTAGEWAHIEHVAFWLAILSVLGAFLPRVWL